MSHGVTTVPDRSLAGYWPAPWTCEDGGPRRWGCPQGQPGLGIGPEERLDLAAVRDAFATDMLIRRDPGELYALRHDIPLRGAQSSPVEAWVERLDPVTLETIGSSPRLPGGPFWPGGIAAHAGGDIHLVFGRWAHRLSVGLDVLASGRLPVNRAHNSFVVLAGGEIVTKDCDAPRGRHPSTVSVLDPYDLRPLAAPLRLPEPVVARLSSDGETVVAIGTASLFRLAFEPGAGRLTLEEHWRPRYGPEPERSFGWDPVLTAKHVFWMDNGANDTDSTMLGTGISPSPVRLWRARLDGDGQTDSVPVSGLPYGTESNPPAFDPVTGMVIAYDAGNGVLAAFAGESEALRPQWRRELAHAGHLILYPDTRELVAGDWRGGLALRRPGVRRALRPIQPLLARSATARRASARIAHDHLVVLDLDSGAEKARIAVPSPCQGYLFPAPGFGRDVYYQSLTTIARVSVA